VIRPAALLLTGLIVSGCMVGPNFTRPDTPPAERYTAQMLRGEAPSSRGAAPAGAAPTDASVQHLLLGQEVAGHWWTLFRSEAIDRIVKDAIDHNRSLAASSATLEQAQALALASSGGRYPQVGLTGGAGRQKYGNEFLGGLANLPPFTYYAVGPTVSYTLDLSGGIARTVEQQYALAEFTRHQLDAAYLAVTGQAVMQTLAIASARAQIATVETVLAQDRENLQLVESAFAEGSVPHADVVSAQSQLASDLTLLPALRQELARAHHALSLVLGRTPASPAPADLDLSDITLPREIPVSLPSELAHRRPDILAAEAQLHAATSAVGIAESNLYPRIQLSATVGQQSLTPGQLFDRANTAWSLISGVTQPLFAGGSLRAEKRAAVAAMHASAATYQETVLAAFDQVADLLEALDHDAEQLDAQRQAQDAAKSNLELARASYAAGNAGVLQVLDAERLVQQGQLGYVRAVAQRYLDTVQLFLALGGENPDGPRRPT
jgi:NodT family efflux transporter outer membrane factor (OMF) lipoprotein